MTISVGCAQLGLDYGIANKTGILKLNDFKKILKKLNKKKSLIDTAINYGNSEFLIGKSLNQVNKIEKYKIITKLPNLRRIKSKNLEYEISKLIQKSLKKMKLKNIYGVLIHDLEDLKSDNSEQIYKILINLKNKGFIKKIGFSAYKIEDVKMAINKFQFDILQFPFNIFDQRLRDKNLLKFLKKKKIKIHIRSIFLQGLLLMDKDEINKKFLKKIKIIDEWLKFLKKKKLSNLEACIIFIKNFDFYDHVIIGFDSYSHFKEVKKIYNKKNIIKINFDKFRNNSQLIYPQKWKLR
mgnify:CR=1 FL=1